MCWIAACLLDLAELILPLEAWLCLLNVGFSFYVCFELRIPNCLLCQTRASGGTRRGMLFRRLLLAFAPICGFNGAEDRSISVPCLCRSYRARPDQNALGEWPGECFAWGLKHSVSS